jgi:formylglycine-generating enzyme
MVRLRSALICCVALGLLPAACAKLVGITDTEVTPNDPDASVGNPGGMGGGGTTVTVAGAGGGGGSTPQSAAGTGGVSGMGGMGGSAGSPPVVMSDAGPADAGGCTDGAARCTPTGREVCGSGTWQPEACAVNQPTCQGDGECVVRGPALISVGGAFFIDATEVTVAQYRQFLEAKAGDTSGQIAVCSWNQSYYEGPTVMRGDDFPMTSVDWCDSAAYCAWAGKHLCGRIGGGAVAVADALDPNLSQWFVACGGPGGGTHPNNTPVCNSSSGTVAAVGSYPGCEGYYDGIFDMEGNVAEWADNCTGNSGPEDVCYPMGGNIYDGNSYCTEYYEDAEDPWLRNSVVISAGFRCCAG